MLYRFTGTAPEPRPGLSSGHMAHSISIPFGALLSTHESSSSSSSAPLTYTTLLRDDKLKLAMVDLLNKSGRNGEDTLDRILRGEQPVVCSCGSGMTASVIWLALQELGIEKMVPLYDEVRFSLVDRCWPCWSGRYQRNGPSKAY